MIEINQSTRPVVARHDMEARVDVVKKLLERTPGQYRTIETYLTEDDVKGKTENFVGAVPIPVGLCGPIDIAGEYARGTFIVPLATLEGTLVASYSRGAKLMNDSGGCEVYVYDDYFLRGVTFSTRSLAQSAQLIAWCKNNEPDLVRAIHETSSHLSVKALTYDCVGSTVTVSIHAETGDAMGSNMMGKAAGALHAYIAAHTHLTGDVSIPYPEDKKYIPRRQKGKKVIARAIVKRDVLDNIARTTPEQLATFITNSKNLLAHHGAYSLNVHAANGMAALFQAFGQDMAYLGECSQALVDCRFIGPDALEVSLTLPTLIIGTVGGGTGLPAFRTTLSMVDCYGNGKSRKLAEIMAAVILAGEIGCAAAISAHEFVRAHETMGKNRPPA
jgi:hydroxymethylglutaryl-CoA reductase (NADPH)